MVRSAQEFWDSLAIRYRKPLLSLTAKCDGCGATSSLDHFLICRRGSLLSSITTKSRMVLVTWQDWLVGKYNMKLVVEAEDQYGETLIADLCAHGVWLPQAEALFDIRIVDTGTQSYFCHTPGRILLNAEVEKNIKYVEACAARCTHFTPLCFFVDGLVGSEANCC